MKESIYKSYDELPLFLNSELVAKVLGVSPSSGYELMSSSQSPLHSTHHICRVSIPLPCSSSPHANALHLHGGPITDFPVLRVGSRMVVPKEKFIQWAEEHTGGAG